MRIKNWLLQLSAIKEIAKKDLTQFEPVFPRSLLSPTTNCDTKPPIGGEEIFRGVLKE